MLVLVEATDLVFATDSIPAVLAITLKPFIVYTSNVFAVLGLRSMYFLLAGMMELFHYLHYGLAAILIFVGAKMLVSNYYPIPTFAALGVVAGVLLISVLASLLNPQIKRKNHKDTKFTRKPGKPKVSFDLCVLWLWLYANRIESPLTMECLRNLASSWVGKSVR